MSKYLLIILLVFPIKLYAQTEREEINRAAANYMKALYQFNFEDAKLYCTPSTYSKVDSVALVFHNLSPNEQQKQRKKSQSLVFNIEEVQIITLDDSKELIDYEVCMGEVLKKRFLHKTQKEAYILRLHKADGKWLVSDPTFAQKQADYYDWFKEKFQRGVELSSNCYTNYGVDEDAVFEFFPWPNDELKTYAQGEIQNLNNGLNLYIVRFRLKVEDTITYEDRLYIADSTHLLPQKESIILGYYTELPHKVEEKQIYWFDWNMVLHICSIKGPFYSGPMPYMIEYERSYNIDTIGLVLKNEILDTLYQPDTYEQFKNLFINNDHEAYPKRLTQNKFISENNYDLDYMVKAVEMRENHQGVDIFFIHSEPRCQEPWAEGTSYGSTSMFAYRHNNPDSLLWKSSLGYSTSHEGGSDDYEYYFNPDSSLTVINIKGFCCSATGYDTPFYNADEYRWFFDGKTNDTTYYTRIYSDFFDIEKLTHLNDYPTSDTWIYLNENKYVNLFFRVDTTQFGKPCLCFTTTNDRANITIDSITLCPKEIKTKLSSKTTPKIPHETAVDAIIETSYGNVEIKRDGTFKRVIK